MKKLLLILFVFAFFTSCYPEKVLTVNEDEYRTLLQLRYKYDLNSKYLNGIRKQALKGELKSFYHIGNDQFYYNYKPAEKTEQ